MGARVLLLALAGAWLCGCVSDAICAEGAYATCVVCCEAVKRRERRLGRRRLASAWWASGWFTMDRARLHSVAWLATKPRGREARACLVR